MGCCNENQVPQIIDFEGADFNWNDFLTGIPSILFRNFLFSRLPDYFKANDSYKDADDKGLLERFMDIMGQELDEGVYPYIYNYLDIIDAQKANSVYLNHISDMLGNPPDIFGSNQAYRNMLSYITSIYKIKGTKKAYQLFFSILGYDVEINEIVPISTESTYDSGGIYDNDNVFENNTTSYDGTSCPACVYYDISLFPRENVVVDIKYDDDFYRRLLEAIKFNEPINSKVRNIYIGLALSDTMDININDVTDVTLRISPTYDATNEYDDNLEYDLYGGQNIGVIINGIIITVIETGGGYYITMSIPVSNSPLDQVIPLSLKAYDSNNDEIYNIDGFLEDILIDSGFLVGVVIQPLIFIPTYNELRLEGEIKTVDGLSSVFNIPLTLGDNTLTLTLQ